MGAVPMAGFPGEKITEGLDGLRERLGEYKKMGARFAKWRAVIAIGNEIPSLPCIDANVHALASYAALCQEAGIVPIVEPEVLMGGDHSLQRCFDTTALVLQKLFCQLYVQRNCTGRNDPQTKYGHCRNKCRRKKYCGGSSGSNGALFAAACSGGCTSYCIPVGWPITR